jgi:hypothetical protein
MKMILRNSVIYHQLESVPHHQNSEHLQLNSLLLIKLGTTEWNMSGNIHRQECYLKVLLPCKLSTKHIHQHSNNKTRRHPAMLPLTPHLN